ncbi:hypothetical protein BpHYR1_047849 [Brachionus plicatilis]|uniref:Uncharacterized protein n=1 Tax=Brachionus plicatilis TaxID=10195 RepID=A0A3M7PIF5_BRAPC|nr:hypothetical protein BpHYR1_047849 [Brachionus plicatilis]
MLPTYDTMLSGKVLTGLAGPRSTYVFYEIFKFPNEKFSKYLAIFDFLLDRKLSLNLEIVQFEKCLFI